MQERKSLPAVGCLVLAAGGSSRFGENKLAAKLHGKMLIEHALDAVPRESFCSVAVVTQFDEIARCAERFGFTVLRNEHPDRGQSYSVRLGTEFLQKDCGAILYQVADQPLLRRESVAAEVSFFLAHPDNIVGMGHGGIRGNPCIFPARFFPELLKIEGDHGGNTVIRRHEEDLLLFEVDAPQLTDVDTRETLELLRD